MKTYYVSIEINGEQVPVGTIRGVDSKDSRFSYNKEYMTTKGAVPISISLPFTDEQYSPSATRTYFEGLLPEGFTRRSVAQIIHKDADDYLGILGKLGRECIGAVRIGSEDDELSCSYSKISKEQIAALASSDASKASEYVTKSHLSLAGASGKVGLYYDEKNDRWYLPQGIAPSTHIVKQSHVRLDGIVINEQLSMMTARRLGIDVSDSFIVNTGNGKDSEILFATGRYDRVIGEDSEKVDGLALPYRLHQEDFAQAMGIPPEFKYEAENEEYAVRMFELIRSYSSDPIADQIKLIDRMIFNCLIGNTDAHIKNFSLLYDAGMKSISLAPAYDIISTVVYESSTEDLSFNIGGIRNIKEIDRDSFVKMAGTVGVGERIVMSEYDELCNSFEQSLHDTAYELKEHGFKEATKLRSKILDNGCVKGMLK